MHLLIPGPLKGIEDMKPTRRLWQLLGAVFVLSFAALGWLGREIYLAAPPIPAAVKTVEGATLYTGDEIQRGQQVWLGAGGQQLGTACTSFNQCRENICLTSLSDECSVVCDKDADCGAAQGCTTFGDLTFCNTTCGDSGDCSSPSCCSACRVAGRGRRTRPS